MPADGDYVATGIDEVCGVDVLGLDVTYFDGTAWLAAWDGRAEGAEAGEVPKAVRISCMRARTVPTSPLSRNKPRFARRSVRPRPAKALELGS